MPLLDDLQNPNKYAKQPGSTCYLCAIIDTLTIEEQTALKKALGNKEIKTSSLTRILKSNGHAIGENSVARHRRGDCNGAHK